MAKAVFDTLADTFADTCDTIGNEKGEALNILVADTPTRKKG